ncbi:MAG: hypothetical protein ACK56F_29245 [bacterium]
MVPHSPQELDAFCNVCLGTDWISAAASPCQSARSLYQNSLTIHFVASLRSLRLTLSMATKSGSIRCVAFMAS